MRRYSIYVTMGFYVYKTISIGSQFNDNILNYIVLPIDFM